MVGLGLECLNEGFSGWAGSHVFTSSSGREDRSVPMECAELRGCG